MAKPNLKKLPQYRPSNRNKLSLVNNSDKIINSDQNSQNGISMLSNLTPSIPITTTLPKRSHKHIRIRNDVKTAKQ